MNGEMYEALMGSDGKPIVGEKIAVRGWPDCRNPTCTRRFDPDNMQESECVGWHCARCGAPTDAQGGHRCTADPFGKERAGE